MDDATKTRWLASYTGRLFEVLRELYCKKGSVDIYAIEEAQHLSTVFELDESTTSEAQGFVSLSQGPTFSNLRLWPRKPHRERGWDDCPAPLFTLHELAQESIRKGPEINYEYFTKVALGDRRETRLLRFSFSLLGLAIELTAPEREPRVP